MKNFYTLLLLLLFPALSYCQCISGPGVLLVGTSGTYSASGNPGQCSQCYNWSLSNGDAAISGTNLNSSVLINAISTGTVILTLNYFDGTGCHQCRDTITIVPPGTCDIPTGQIISFVNALGSPDLLFYSGTPVGLGGATSFSYFWTFTYGDGSTSNSTDQNPVFPVDCSNPVVRATVVISSGICSITLTKQWLTGICGTDGLGIQAVAAPLIKVSPNPTNSLIRFEGKNLQQYKVSVVDVSGKYIIKDASLLTPVDIAKSENGTYLYVITDRNGVTQRGKVIKTGN
ncbi:hypothetical protein F5148DRAFT_1289530 [Russula earlei]|uniref:Uncharacterized protein n=1 Tax=Russula earlei TaxID=71964 RepID=A0ACC0TXG1_9AGAM|nr:hypothetical protein F5148DRAFT_1289530 [Russula earlei]